MAFGDAAPYPAPGATDGPGEKVFTIPAEKMAQYKQFKEEHNKTCQYPEWFAGFTPTSKYHYRFRETGLGDSIQLYCDCGEKFYADAGDEDL